MPGSKSDRTAGVENLRKGGKNPELSKMHVFIIGCKGNDKKVKVNI